MPFALTIGVPHELFWHLTPNKLPSFYKSFKQRQKIRDEEMWIMGQYIMSALDSTVCNNAIWKGEHGKPSKYIEKPILQSDATVKEKDMSRTELEKKAENVFLQLGIMGANFNNQKQGQ